MSKAGNKITASSGTPKPKVTKPARKRAPGGGGKADDGVCDPERKLVLVDPATVAVLTAVGGGNLSLGIREAARRLVELGDTVPFSAVRHSTRVGRS